MKLTHAPAAGGLLAALLALAAGCGPGEERLFDVTGTVAVGGTPVPAGMVFFDPAGPTGGTQGFANIKDGKFNTADGGRGVRGGAYRVRVSGFDGKAANEAPMGQTLFPEYEFAKELPKQNSELTIDVPKKR